MVGNGGRGERLETTPYNGRKGKVSGNARGVWDDISLTAGSHRYT